MDLKLKDRTVVVTGGTGALGRAVVARLLAEGAKPVVTWRSERELRDFPAGDRVRFQQAADLADETSVAALYRGLDDLWASVHLAGGFAMASAVNTSAADFLAMFSTNALSCFLCCREAVRKIRSAENRGAAAGGRIVNVAARPAISPTGGMVAYSTSKAAVASITQSLAEEVKPDGIWVNAVAPSIMDTPANRAAMPNADYTTWPRVEQVADAILYLASPANALTTGAIVPVYGKA
jgi:NAD(P)-dependent dehydrogenase (short-subunit alcohol dehydrogenase family)